MERKEILSFIEKAAYSLETVNSLQEFNRKKESLFIVDAICAEIEGFQKRKNEGPYDLKDIFDDVFWDAPVKADQTLGSIRQKIREVSREWMRVSEDDLKGMEYDRFLLVLEKNILKNAALLRQRIKTEIRKKIEKAGVFVLVLAACAGVIFFAGSYVMDRTIAKDWGLQGTVYEGRNLKKAIGTKRAKTIDFKGRGDMGLKIKPRSFSVHWRGYLVVHQEGRYRFAMRIDDDAKLFINGQRVLEGTYREKNGYHSGTVFLKKGQHEIRIEHYQGGGPGQLSLLWARGKETPRIIPSKYLRIKKE